MKLVEIKEGNTSILVPEFEEGLGPKKSGDKVFYNPAMQLNRDISVSFLKYWGNKNKRVLDGMGATGIRGIRISNETEVENVDITDISEDANKLIKKNILKNDLKYVNAVHEAIEIQILENRYDYHYIDIDPFGTPVPYFPIAAEYVSHEGVIAVTATDTALLCGTYPKACYRRYSAWPKNNWCRHENGLRILIGYCAREAARHDRAITPLISYYDGHYFRTYLKIEESKTKADKVLEKLKTYDFTEFSWKEDGDAGPLWSGRLFSECVLDNLDPIVEFDDKLLDLWKKEEGFPPFFYDTNIIGKRFKIAPPPMDEVINRLKDEGYKASKTHFTPTGIKTDAPEEFIEELFK